MISARYCLLAASTLVVLIVLGFLIATNLSNNPDYVAHKTLDSSGESLEINQSEPNNSSHFSPLTRVPLHLVSAPDARLKARSQVEDELELRNSEIVDLIESDKTFGLIKYRITVRTYKSAPLFRQRPSLLSSTQATEPTPANRPVVLTANTLRVPKERSIFVGEQEEAKMATPLTSTIEPNRVFSPDSNDGLDGLDRLNRPTIGQFVDTLLTHGRVKREHQTGTLMSLDDSMQPDPLQVAASELRSPPSSLNHTLTECFLVDTDKRLHQRLAIEDKYRLVASTRRVTWAHMSTMINRCRLLTWASPANKINIIQTNNLEPSKQAAKTQSNNASLLENIFNGVLNRLEPRVQSLRQQASNQLANSRPAQDPTDPTRSYSSYLTNGISMINGIVPNTLWCGLGDRAANYSELGVEYKLDACCRAHDHCPIRLKPWTSDYGLINWSVSTRSHCDCDAEFNSCLAQVNSTLSNVLRVVYFRFIGLQCIEFQDRQTSV